MDEICTCVKGLGNAAEALFFAIAFQTMAATTFLLAVMFLG